MEQSPSWEADRFSASQEFPRILRKPEVHYAFSSVRHLSLSWARVEFLYTWQTGEKIQ